MTAVLTAPAGLTPRRLKAPVLRRLAIVVRDDAYDRLLTPLTFALETARRGGEVDILFSLWAARLLTRKGVYDVRMDSHHEHQKAWLRRRLAMEGDPPDVYDFLMLLSHTRRVRLHACQLAAQTFDVNQDDLLPEAVGIIHPSDFLENIALQADHTQYF